jgi:hypothetical protein
LALAEDNLKTGEAARSAGLLEMRASIDLENYTEEIRKKIDQFKKDGNNAEAKLKLDTDLLKAEKDYLDQLSTLPDLVKDENYLVAKQNAQRRKNIEAGSEARNSKELFNLEIQDAQNKLLIAEGNKLITAEQRLEKANLDLATQQINLAIAYKSLETEILDPQNRSSSIFVGKQKEVNSTVTGLRGVREEGAVSTYANGEIRKGKVEAAIRGSIIDNRLTAAAQDVKKFEEKPSGDGAYVNGGYFILNKKCIKFIDNNFTKWEEEPLENLAKQNQLSVWKHEDIWSSMDTLRDKQFLDNLWNTNQAPWKL